MKLARFGRFKEAQASRQCIVKTHLAMSSKLFHTPMDEYGAKRKVKIKMIEIYSLASWSLFMYAG